jgi:hypothetical protein
MEPNEFWPAVKKETKLRIVYVCDFDVSLSAIDICEAA